MTSSRLSAIVSKSDSAEAPAPAIDSTVFAAVTRHLLDISKSLEESLTRLADITSQPLKLGDAPIENINPHSPGLSPASKAHAMAYNARQLSRKRISDLLDSLAE